MYRKKRLNIAIFHLAFLYSGGGERLVLEEAIRLQNLGHKVTCFIPVASDKNCFPELLNKVKIKRLLPKILPNWYPDSALLSILGACVFSPLLFFRYREFDLYLGANQPGPWLAFVLSKINKKPYIIYLAQPTRLIHPRLIDQQVGLRLNFGFSMLNIITKVFKPLISLLDVISIKNANTILANGSYAKGLLEEVYKIKAVNCPAGSDLQKKVNNSIIAERFSGKYKLGVVYIQKPYVLLTNRHFPHKKFEYAMEAFLKMKRKRIELVITGQETEYTLFLKKKYKKFKRIRFVGLLSEVDLNKLYSNAALYVYPAPEEDFGMGIVEAMSHGLPVVAWGNAGPTGIIKHEYDGFLARPFDTTNYAYFMDKVLKNKIMYEKISIAAQEKVQKHFTYKAHVRLIDRQVGKLYTKWKKNYTKHSSYKREKKSILKITEARQVSRGLLSSHNRE